jgi:hypothetical protein
VLRHLGIAEHAAGRFDAARERLEESLRLRRESGFLPGVTANLVGLAYVAAAQDHRDEAIALVEEAGAIAEASGAQGIMRQVKQARTSLYQETVDQGHEAPRVRSPAVPDAAQEP